MGLLSPINKQNLTFTPLDIKNPISAARLVLDNQDKPLSLQRVPPNFLVGQGATDFAYDYGLPVVPDDYLISPTANSRWLRWQQNPRRY